MNDLTTTFGELFFPVKTFVLYRKRAHNYQQECYVESYDMSADGAPMNAHPLSAKESQALAKALTTKTKKEGSFLTPEGLLPANVLYIGSGKSACAVWRTPTQMLNLLFDEGLDIPCGEAHIPALVWKADRNNLQVFAIREKRKVIGTTKLYHAPFFNLNEKGKVCMGNVPVKIPANCGLERFMSLWQEYFFNSYFTHLLGGFNPVSGNIIQLWQGLVGHSKPFPAEKLLPNHLQIKNLLP